MLTGELTAQSVGGQSRLIKVDGPRDEERVGDAIATGALVMRGQTEFIEIDAHLADGVLDDHGIAMQGEDANGWIDPGGQQRGVVRRDKVCLVRGHHRSTSALVFEARQKLVAS